MAGLPWKRAAEVRLAAAALAILAAVPQARAAPKLFWLAPDRIARGGAQVGLTSVDGGMARLPLGARVGADGAALEELAPEGEVRVFALAPRAAVIRLRAEDGAAVAQAGVEVGPPAAAVSVSAEPAAAVKGRDPEVALHIAVLRGDGRPDAEASPPVLRSNVGEVVDLRALGGGRFEASFRLPETRHPEVAIVVAFAPWPHADSAEGAIGAAIIPLSSMTSLPGRTEPGASIAVDIAGRTFGPVRSDASGRFELPVIVPPGHRFGSSRATDRAGNSRVKPLDLQLPPTDQLACVANPSSLPADGRSRARVLCIATDPFGAPAAAPALRARARAGALRGPSPAPGGALTWEYLAPGPSEVRPEELVFEYPAGGQQSVERLALKLTGEALASADFQLTPQPVFAGGSASAVLTPRDAHGRLAAARPRLKAQRGALGDLTARPDGRYEATYRAPDDAGDWSDRISGEILPSARPVAARLELSASRGELAVRAVALDGSPVEDLLVGLAAVRGRTGPDGAARFPMPSAASAELARVEARAADRPSLHAAAWLLRTSRGLQLFPDAGAPSALRLDQPVGLAPAPPVDLRIELETAAGAAVRVRALDPRGKPLEGREVALEIVRPGGAPVAHGPAQPQPDGSVVFKVAERVAGEVTAVAVDVASGVSAAREASFP